MNAKEYLKQNGWDEPDETFCKALEDYHQAKSKEEAWISVKEGLPIQRCLLLTTSKIIVIGDFYKGIWRIDGATHWVSRESGNGRVVNRYRELQSDYNKEDITHWQTLPEVLAAFGKEGE